MFLISVIFPLTCSGINFWIPLPLISLQSQIFGSNIVLRTKIASSYSMFNPCMNNPFLLTPTKYTCMDKDKKKRKERKSDKNKKIQKYRILKMLYRDCTSYKCVWPKWKKIRVNTFLFFYIGPFDDLILTINKQFFLWQLKPWSLRVSCFTA